MGFIAYIKYVYNILVRKLWLATFGWIKERIDWARYPYQSSRNHSDWDHNYISYVIKIGMPIFMITIIFSFITLVTDWISMPITLIIISSLSGFLVPAILYTYVSYVRWERDQP